MIVTQLNIPSVRNASRVYDLLLEMGAPEESLQIVLNRCRAEHERVNADDVERHFRRPVFAMIPNDYCRVTAALDFGHPMMADAPNSPARLAIHQLAKTITSGGRTGDDSGPTASPKGGLFQRWLGGTKRPPTGVGG
jgi:Flp pilus assembly CpaE family ATPase